MPGPEPLVGITVRTVEDANYEKMAERVRLAPTPYAIVAETANRTVPERNTTLKKFLRNFREYAREICQRWRVWR